MLRLFSATMVLIISQTSKYLSVPVLYYILIDTVACDTRMVTDSKVHQNIGREKACMSRPFCIYLVYGCILSMK